MADNRVELQRGDVLVYKGKEIDRGVLNAMVDCNKRVLWAFVSSDCGTRIMAVPYTEHQVIWMTPEDVLQPNEVEI